jgi:transposase
VSAVPDLPQAIPAMGAIGDFQTHRPRAGRGPLGARRHRHPRSLHRRHLCYGKKRGLAVGKAKRGKGAKILAIADAAGLPVAAHIESASPHEVKRVEPTVDRCFTPYAPDRLIGDKAYDGDKPDQRFLSERGFDLIAPHCKNRRRPCTRDGRTLRRYKRRWKIARLFSWLQNFRRLVVRYECHAENFRGLLQLGCAIIRLRFF